MIVNMIKKLLIEIKNKFLMNNIFKYDHILNISSHLLHKRYKTDINHYDKRYEV